jgi:putative hemolysin
MKYLFLQRMTSVPEKKFIDIEEVIKSKNPQLLKVLPGFILSYIKRIVHEDHVNEFIRVHGHKTSFEFVDAIIDEFKPIVSFSGLENIPVSGGAVVAANHPLGGLDAMALLKAIGQKRRDLKFIVNDVLLNIKNFENEFIGVNKHGKNSSQTLDLIDSYYNSEQLVLIFPAGLVSRKQEKGIIKDLEWKKSFIVKAKKFKKDIIPVHISGNNSNFFYNLAKIRQKVGIKANIEMFYLMDEMYHQKDKKIHITFGKPISYTVFTNKFPDQVWAQKMKSHIYSLADGKPSHEFQGTDINL